MKKSKAAKANQQQQNGHALPVKFAKLLDPDTTWEKDQLCDVLHWIRQALGLVFGLLWGAVPLVGAIWIVVFLVVSSAIIYAYYAHVLKIDEEEFGGHGALIQEGLFASLTLFLDSSMDKFSLLSTSTHDPSTTNQYPWTPSSMGQAYLATSTTQVSYSSLQRKNDIHRSVF